MIWRNPWAWLGLLGLTVPLLVHLLARRRSRRMPFPTLRFLEPTPPAAVRRSRLSDPLLMALRMLVLAAAVAALAQPYLHTPDRANRAAARSSVAVVVDTSWSMERATPEGERAVDVARRMAEGGVEGTSAHWVIETAAPGEALRGLAAWLEGRSGVREIRVISDFQRGAVDSLQLADVPPEVGLDLRKVPVEGVLPPRVIQHGESETFVRATAGVEGTDAVWERRGTDRAHLVGVSPGDRAPQGPDSPLPSLRLLHAPADSGGAAALRLALEREAVPALDRMRPVTVLFPGAEDADEVIARARAPGESWMGDVILSLSRDEGATPSRGLVHEPDVTPEPDLDDPLPDPFVPVLLGVDGRPTVLAAALEHDEEDRLLIVTRFGPGTLASASLLSALGRAAHASPAWHELDEETLTDEELGRWNRAGLSTGASAGDIAASDGRWAWILVLSLLLGEGLLRRRLRREGRGKA